jgi:hypothetical protein
VALGRERPVRGLLGLGRPDLDRLDQGYSDPDRPRSRSPIGGRRRGAAGAIGYHRRARGARGRAVPSGWESSRWPGAAGEPSAEPPAAADRTAKEPRLGAAMPGRVGRPAAGQAEPEAPARSTPWRQAPDRTCLRSGAPVRRLSEVPTRPTGAPQAGAAGYSPAAAVVVAHLRMARPGLDRRLQAGSSPHGAEQERRPGPRQRGRRTPREAERRGEVLRGPPCGGRGPPAGPRWTMSGSWHRSRATARDPVLLCW